MILTDRTTPTLPRFCCRFCREPFMVAALDDTRPPHWSDAYHHETGECVPTPERVDLVLPPAPLDASVPYREPVRMWPLWVGLLVLAVAVVGVWLA